MQCSRLCTQGAKRTCMASLYKMILEQSRDLSFRCHVDAVGSGIFAEAGHGHDGTGDGYDKACAGVYIDVADIDVEAGGTAELCLVS